MKVSQLLGHQERCFDLKYTDSRKELISASEDGTACIWNIDTRKCIEKLSHSKNSEVLRCGIWSIKGSDIPYSCGADGNILLWKIKEDNKGSEHVVLGTLGHGDRQVYGTDLCSNAQSNSNANNLNCSQTQIVSIADEMIFLWDIETMSLLRCSSMDTNSNFGGPRNPLNLSYLFDIKSCPAANSIISIGSSDNSVKLLDCRESNFFLSHNLGLSSHPTSVSKDRHSLYLFMTIIWNLAIMEIGWSCSFSISW